MAIQGGGKGAAAPSASQLASFQRIVLSWDYLRLLKEHSQKKGAAASSGLKKVKATYKDVADYMNVFEPLLFEEVKAHIVQGRDNEENPECYKGVVVSCVEDANDFHMVSMGVKSEVTEEISENDLLLLSNEKAPHTLGDVEGKVLEAFPEV